MVQVSKSWLKSFITPTESSWEVIWCGRFHYNNTVPALLTQHQRCDRSFAFWLLLSDISWLCSVKSPTTKAKPKELHICGDYTATFSYFCQALAMSRITWNGVDQSPLAKTMCFPWRIAKTFVGMRWFKTLSGFAQTFAVNAKTQWDLVNWLQHVACLGILLEPPARVS